MALPLPLHMTPEAPKASSKPRPAGRPPERGDTERFVARGVAHFSLDEEIEPVWLTFVLVPDFTMLAFTSALEPFRVANQLAGKPLFLWRTHSACGQPVASSGGITVAVDAPLPTEAPPGYVLICGGVTPERTMTRALADWARRQWRMGRVVGGLCTGAYALARAGILQGRRFTLHWENISGFKETFPELEPARQVYCIEDRVVTCAGGVAAADLALQLINDHFGSALGQEVMNMCLLTQRRQGGEQQITSLAARLRTRNPRVIRATSFLQSRFEDGFDLVACAQHAGVTQRQLQRLFSQHLNMSPLEYWNDMRLCHGRALLAETDMTVLEVAVACGYGSASHFSKSFRKKFNISPHRFSHFGGKDPGPEVGVTSSGSAAMAAR